MHTEKVTYWRVLYGALFRNYSHIDRKMMVPDNK